MQPLEEIAQCPKLGAAETVSEERSDARDMVACGASELLPSGVGQLRVDDACVGIAGRLLDEARTLQALEKARDTRRRQQHLLREIDPAHHAIRCSVQPQQHLVVVDGQTVIGDELTVETAHHTSMRPDKVDERLDLDALQ